MAAKFAPDLDEMPYPDVCVTAPVAACVLLGHDDEAPTLRLDRSALFAELARRDAEEKQAREAKRAAKQAEPTPDFRDEVTLDVQREKLFGDAVSPTGHAFLASFRARMTPPTLPPPAPVRPTRRSTVPPAPSDAAASHLEDAAPIRLVRRKDAWMEQLPPAARAVLDDASSLQPSWPLRQRVVGAVAIPKQRIPSLRPRSRR